MLVVNNNVQPALDQIKKEKMSFQELIDNLKNLLNPDSINLSGTFKESLGDLMKKEMNSTDKKLLTEHIKQFHSFFEKSFELKLTFIELYNTDKHFIDKINLSHINNIGKDEIYFLDIQIVLAIENKSADIIKLYKERISKCLNSLLKGNYEFWFKNTTLLEAVNACTIEDGEWKPYFFAEKENTLSLKDLKPNSIKKALIQINEEYGTTYSLNEN